MKIKDGYKLAVKVESPKGTKELTTISVYDTRTKKQWTEEQIKERGITWFMDMDDMKETLNWNLNGDSKKYKFQWEYTTVGTAYIYD